jgi:hypothetical protein
VHVTARPRMTGVVFAACAAAATGWSWFVAQHSLIGARWTFVLLLAAWIPLWVGGAWTAGRIQSHKLALAAVLITAAAVRLVAVTGTTPSVSNDLYRYGWDAHVQLSGINPYRYPPDAPQLARLRTATYFPGPAECAHIHADPSCTTINRPDVRTIYPPAAEAWFDLVSLVDPASGIRKWQIAGGVVDMATVGLLVIGLRRLGRDTREVAWYALSPLPVIEFAGNGHVDGLGLLLLIAAFLALRRDRWLLAGTLIGLAAMVKLYPGVALLGGWKQGRWRMVAGAAGVAILSYLPHVAAVGTRIVGYLPGYLTEEHYNNGGRFLVLRLLPLPGHLLVVVAAVAVAVAAAEALRRGAEPLVATTIILSVALLVASPVQPWYAVVLAGLGILAGAPWLALIALLAEPYYAAVILDDPHQIGAGELCYLAAAVTLLVIVARGRLGQRVRIGAMSSTRLY